MGTCKRQREPIDAIMECFPISQQQTVQNLHSCKNQIEYRYRPQVAVPDLDNAGITVEQGNKEGREQVDENGYED